MFILVGVCLVVGAALSPNIEVSLGEFYRAIILVGSLTLIVFLIIFIFIYVNARSIKTLPRPDVKAKNSWPR